MNLLEHRRFRAAYDFMLLLADAGEIEPSIAKFWTDVQDQTAEQRAISFKVSGGAKAKRRPRKRRKRKAASADSS